MFPVPESVVVPLLIVSVLVPTRLALIAPPVEVTAPVRAPFWIVPPAKLTVLIVCPAPPRSSVPLALTVVALAELKMLAALAVSSPPLIVVAPV